MENGKVMEKKGGKTPKKTGGNGEEK